VTTLDLTAVVVHNEPVVEPLLAAFREAGWAVPDDLSMVPICPDELAERPTRGCRPIFRTMSGRLNNARMLNQPSPRPW
jgi:substrate-binding family protein